eukprot:1989945-Alexandrium_andersonii.AAC.1
MLGSGAAGSALLVAAEVAARAKGARVGAGGRAGAIVGEGAAAAGGAAAGGGVAIGVIAGVPISLPRMVAPVGGDGPT